MEFVALLRSGEGRVLFWHKIETATRSLAASPELLPATWARKREVSSPPIIYISL